MNLFRREEVEAEAAVALSPPPPRRPKSLLCCGCAGRRRRRGGRRLDALDEGEWVEPALPRARAQTNGGGRRSAGAKGDSRASPRDGGSVVRSDDIPRPRSRVEATTSREEVKFDERGSWIPVSRELPAIGGQPAAARTEETVPRTAKGEAPGSPRASRSEKSGDFIGSTRSSPRSVEEIDECRLWIARDPYATEGGVRSCDVVPELGGRVRPPSRRSDGEEEGETEEEKKHDEDEARGCMDRHGRSRKPRAADSSLLDSRCRLTVVASVDESAIAAYVEAWQKKNRGLPTNYRVCLW